jgi:bifunctional UDP-N-acetylglucosamine pyrophosphorylase / glucosamine-1-phosphate N-acetyltransferase
VNNPDKLSIFGLVLAAGKGTRMGADLPKVLLPVAGKAIVTWVLEALQAARVENVGLVIGGDLEKFAKVTDAYPRLRVWEQKSRLGTADAVAATVDGFPGVARPPYANGEFLKGEPVQAEYVLVCLGDTPAITSQTLTAFIAQFMAAKAEIGVIGMVHPNPKGYGRLVLDGAGRLHKVVEEKDADDKTRAINLCNTGIMLAKTQLLFAALKAVTPKNKQNEYYLTDCFEISCRLGKKPFVYKTELFREFDGINDPAQLKSVEAWLMERRNH